MAKIASKGIVNSAMTRMEDTAATVVARDVIDEEIRQRHGSPCPYDKTMEKKVAPINARLISTWSFFTMKHPSTNRTRRECLT